MSVAWLGLVSTAAATLVYFRLIATAGPTFLSLINYLIPLVAVAAGVVFLDEQLRWSALVALAIILAGLALGVVVGAESFALVGLKPDLGALLVGMTLAGHRRAPELAETLLSFKDILLIGFFLSIGLGGVPDGAGLAAAVIVVAILPIKTALYVLSLIHI